MYACKILPTALWLRNVLNNQAQTGSAPLGATIGSVGAVMINRDNLAGSYHSSKKDAIATSG